MIYSASFDGLPAMAKQATYARLTQADRIAIVDILRATKPDLPAYFAAIGAAESASGAGSSR